MIIIVFHWYDNELINDRVNFFYFYYWQVKWVRLLYSDFSAFTKDQEQLISITGRKQNIIGLDYVEGSLLMHQGPINNWRSSFFPLADHGRIISQVTQHRVLYCLEVAKYYDGQSENNVDKVRLHSCAIAFMMCPFVSLVLYIFQITPCHTPCYYNFNVVSNILIFMLV